MQNPHTSPLWPGKLFAKIDVFYNGAYLHSTNACASIKNAILSAQFTHRGAIDCYTAHYDKNPR
jgi:S-adenosylmethionine/arginine decarboxylase-like enzyme